MIVNTYYNILASSMIILVSVHTRSIKEVPEEMLCNIQIYRRF